MTAISDSSPKEIFSVKLFIENNFLPKQVANTLFDYTLRNEGYFTPSTITTGEKDYRKSLVLRKPDKIKDMFETRIRQLLPDAISQFNVSLDVDSDIDLQITASSQGDFFKIHNDNGDNKTNHRKITFVYYFMKQPQSFSGGDLKIYDYRIENKLYVPASTFRTISPVNNSIIIFPSFQLHEVEKVRNNGVFINARFTVNGWIGNRKKEAD